MVDEEGIRRKHDLLATTMHDSWYSNPLGRTIRPSVGGALNWQGQPHAQSQLTTFAPLILHFTLLMAKPLHES